MSLEPGGRSDKYGNEYENRYLATLLLRLVQEKLSSIIVEPIGDNSDSVEFIAKNKDGVAEYYQCKASNGTHLAWSIADLRRYDVFSRIKNILSENTDAHYFFISSLPYKELDELCKRARTVSSYDGLVNHLLTNKTIRNTFADCANAFGLDRNSSQDQRQLLFLLSHCYFEQYAFGEENVRALESDVSIFFTGKAAEVRVLLEQFANSTGKYGISITAKDVIDYLDSVGIHARNLFFDKRVLPRIIDLNEIYWDKYPAINGKLLHRDATSRIIRQIKDGGSVILHGKAGSGKSGCLQETIDYLKQQHVLYLAVKLSKISPKSSADEFGRELGLPESPVYCLANLSSDSPCVLILDQLDALRWTANHSAAALSVCKELICQAEALNKHSGKRVSIVFASRTFDLENDSGLKNLFNNDNPRSSLAWDRICVDTFSEDEAVQCIGQSYYSLSSRLQKLLRTPSSLYVWTQLEESRKKNSVSSVQQLMAEWWCQIQNNTIAKGVKQDTVNACKNKIVSRMEKTSVLALPTTTFVDDRQTLEFLASNGMLIFNRDTISFVHQSFLDYFIISDLLSKIYDGVSIVTLLGPYDEQTPQVRYRLVAILQNLIDADQSMFVLQGRAIIESAQIHYYFKCAVFEVIGQCDAPDQSVFSFVEQYASHEEWRSYIIQTVYSAHPVFIKHMDTQGCDWFEDTNLSLLKSISCLDPDFVVTVLQSHTINDFEDARRVYSTLCSNIADDSEQMFHFRTELLKRYPELFKNCWGFAQLFFHHPARVICLCKIILEESNVFRFKNIYLAEKKEISDIISSQYELIVKELLPSIDRMTSALIAVWPFNYFSFYEEYRDWFSDSLENSVLREIVDITKQALAEYSMNNPQDVCAQIDTKLYSSSAVIHELLAHAIFCLPVEYGDYAIQWLLRDFSGNAFVFTDDQEDYLSYAKRIIRKFSPECSIETFQQLEDTICAWKESSERMCETYRRRVDANKSGNYAPVYYTFWGHMQKELLPCLDSNRVSRYSMELNQVLQRNTWVQSPHFYSGFRMGAMKTVISPVEHYAERISDRRWLKIISTPDEKMGKHMSDRDDSCYAIEADHSAFSDSLRRQAKLNPSRFARLSLSFPDKCYSGYITGVLFALEEENENRCSVDFELVCQVIRRFCVSPDSNIAIAITRIIEKRAKEPWPDDILDLLQSLATKHPDPKPDGYSITSSDDPGHLSVRSLQENEINCSRGCAAHAISALLWEQQDLRIRFLTAVTTLCKDKNPSVRFAALRCLLPLYNLNSSFAIANLKQLINTDLRIVGAHGFWEIMFLDYLNDSHFYCETLLDACKSNIEDLSEYAASMLCALAIFLNDPMSYDAITTLDFSEKQLNEICKQAVFTYENVENVDRCKDIILKTIDRIDGHVPSLDHLFYQDCISLQRDSDFLICLMKSRHSHELMPSFLYYLNKSDEDISIFAEHLKALSESLLCSPSNGRGWLYAGDLVQCVIRLSDRGRDIPAARTVSLEIWDNLFKSDLRNLTPLSDLIDNY